MTLSNRLYIISLITILIPGLFLGYLSLRTIQHEKELISQSQNIRQNEFLRFSERVLTNLEESYLDSFERRLIQSTASPQKNYFFLATDLLSSPLIKGLVVLEGNDIILPGRTDSAFYHGTMGRSASKAYRNLNEQIITRVHVYYKQGLYRECIRWIHRFNKIPGNKFLRGPLGNQYYYGFKLLELKCYKELRMYTKAIRFGQEFIQELLYFQQVADYQQLQFYLEEVLSSLTSMEMLSKESRDRLWDIRSRTESFFKNAMWVHRSWNPKGEFLAQLQGKVLSNGLQVLYLDGVPYLKVRFPWIDSRYQIIARIDEQGFLGQLHSEAQGAWKDMRYIVYNLNDIPIDTNLNAPIPSEPANTETPSITPDQERILNTSILQWKMALFHQPDQERLAVGKRKILLLYILLVFAAMILIVGTFTTVRSLQHESRTMKMKSNFLSAVTHELRTPLTSIRLLSEMLSSGRQSETTKVQKYARLIGEESNRLQGLVEKVLNSAKLEQKQASIQDKDTPPTSLERILEEAKSMLAEPYAKKSISLVFDLKPVPQILGDREEIYSVIQNLLDNALKYSPFKTQVTVRLRKEPSGVLLSIQDQGIGIATNQQKLIFKRFYRVQDEMTRNTKGTGLGLALVRQILDRHQAKISVQSTIQKGTTFNILFTRYEKLEESSA